MIELSHIFASLVDPSTGKILIKDLEKEVNPGTDSQIFAKYKINIDIQTNEIENKMRFFMSVNRSPPGRVNRFA